MQVTLTMTGGLNEILEVLKGRSNQVNVLIENPERIGAFVAPVTLAETPAILAESVVEEQPKKTKAKKKEAIAAVLAEPIPAPDVPQPTAKEFLDALQGAMSKNIQDRIAHDANLTPGVAQIAAATFVKREFMGNIAKHEIKVEDYAGIVNKIQSYLNGAR